MKRIALTAAAVLALSFLLGFDTVEDAAKDVDYDVHSGYFESNKSSLTGDSSYLAFASRKTFDAVFGAAAVPGEKPRLLPDGAFDSKIVVVVIKRGKAIYDYKIEKITDEDGVLTLQYTTSPQDSSGTAMFATPLIVSVDKGKYTSVAFIENGKKVATAKFAE